MSGLIGTRWDSSGPLRNRPEEEFDEASGGHRVCGNKTSFTSQEAGELLVRPPQVLVLIHFGMGWSKMATILAPVIG